ncbi:glucokinase-like [Diaphorina citri]|uniref:Phosphotransferase n=1 Tax=Diaphorina citri TaxID=121845 RepID=A0A3Q0J5R2_DIACI|nr:glucokinase-like [Diaphorina citri]
MTRKLVPPRSFSEQGQFLALDLGGTNFRVILMHLKKGLVTDEIVKHYHIPDELRLGSGLKLFDFLAACISDFVHEYQVHDRVIPMGFTFSFPMHQRSLDSGILVTWTKSFKSSGVEKEDVVKMLKDAIHRRQDNHVEIVCVLNDTTGKCVRLLNKMVLIRIVKTIWGPNYMMAVIFLKNHLHFFSTLDYRSSNGRVVKQKKIVILTYDDKTTMLKLYASLMTPQSKLIVNVMNSSLSLTFRVIYLVLIQRSFTFEKYISGKYLGELVRVVLCRLVRDGLLFNGVSSEDLVTPNAFRTSFVSLIEQDSVMVSLIITQRRFNFIMSHNFIMFSVSGTAVLVRRIDRDDITIAVDGSLYKYHPRLKHWLQKYIQLLVPNKTFRLLLAEDGSGKGAGLASAIALKLGAFQSK